MARCNNCNKFVSNDEQDPEVESLEIDTQGNVTMTVRIVNACGECGSDLRDHTFDDVSVDKSEECENHLGDGHELDIAEDGSERTQRSEGKGRGMRTFYGFQVNFTIRCSCDADKGAERWSISGEASDDVQASAMDEC